MAGPARRWQEAILIRRDDSSIWHRDTLQSQSPEAVIAELAACKETIRDLREKGRRAVADRDRWEAECKTLQQEIANLKAGAARAGRPPEGKFRELKAALARMLHPDAPRSESRLEATAREELYKEITAEINRIERKQRGP